MNAILARARELLAPHPGWLALLSALGLTVMGLLAIDTVDPGYAHTQVQWVPVALLAMFLCALPHPRTIGLWAFPLGVVSLLLLIMLITPGVPAAIVPPRNGARCWINLYFMMFQPGEPAKIVYILALARYLRFRDNYRTLPGLAFPFLMTLLPMFLLVKQPDLGMALLFMPTLMAVLLAAGAKMRHLLSLVAIGLIIAAINVSIIYAMPVHPFLKPHQVDRIKGMIRQIQGDTSQAQRADYQPVLAKTLVGSGGLWGLGQERAETLLKFNKLPEAHNDMIFAVIAVRWGFVGGLVMLLLYLLMLISFLLTALRNRDPFARLAVVGFGALLFAQTMINVGMTIGLMPITGLTLPFISYGGSSLVTTFAIIGLTINFASRDRNFVLQPSFEFDEAEGAVE